MDPKKDNFSNRCINDINHAAEVSSSRRSRAKLHNHLVQLNDFDRLKSLKEIPLDRASFK